MKPETIKKLLTINRQFYQTFAEAFDATRQRVQPGVARALGRVLDAIPPDARVLDLGCGNGEVARELARRGFRGAYVGVDASEGLLEAARLQTSEVFGDFGSLVTFIQRDLTAPDWDTGLEGPFDGVLAFAVFHHLPPVFVPGILGKVWGLMGGEPASRRVGESTNQRISESASRRVGESTNQRISESASRRVSESASQQYAIRNTQYAIRSPFFILSNWQFLNSPRWQVRIQPWERVGLTASDVGPDDYLLDWRRGGEGLRYVHHFSEAELAALAEGAGFEVVETFFSDGAEGNLGIYQVWTI